MKSHSPKKSVPRPRNSGAIAAAAIRGWNGIEAQLTPVIGDSGFRVLFARSLYRARLEHPWLADEPGVADFAFSTLKASLESQAPDRAEVGNRALMAQFAELLDSLIGKQLASRLLS